MGVIEIPFIIITIIIISCLLSVFCATFSFRTTSALANRDSMLTVSVLYGVSVPDKCADSVHSVNRFCAQSLPVLCVAFFVCFVFVFFLSSGQRSTQTTDFVFNVGVLPGVFVRDNYANF